MPGCRSALNTSAPAKVAVNELMMKRGTGLPSLSLRWPVSITCEMSVLISITSPTLARSGSLTRGLVMPRPPARLAAATTDGDLHQAPRQQELAVAHLRQADHVLGPGEAHAAGHRRPARKRREAEGGHVRLRV